MRGELPSSWAGCAIRWMAKGECSNKIHACPPIASWLQRIPGYFWGNLEKSSCWVAPMLGADKCNMVNYQFGLAAWTKQILSFYSMSPEKEVVFLQLHNLVCLPSWSYSWPTVCTRHRLVVILLCMGNVASFKQVEICLLSMLMGSPAWTSVWY